MAVSIDQVYQTVLALANKEQRGYITPQEFNLYADYAQMSIFEQYFYDLGQFQRRRGTGHEYADIVSNIEEKLNLFKKYNAPLTITNNGIINLDTYLLDLYRLGNININYMNPDKTVSVEELSLQQHAIYARGSLTSASKSFPIFKKYQDGNSTFIRIYPSPVDVGAKHFNVLTKASYICKPAKPNWTYIVVDEKPLYNPTANDHKDFSLHASEKNELIVKILQLAGVTIKDGNLVQAAAQEEVKNIQQEKQ